MDKQYKHLNGDERGVILAEHRRGASLAGRGCCPTAWSGRASAVRLAAAGSVGEVGSAADAMAGTSSDKLPAFVPVSVEAENCGLSADAGPIYGVITIEIGGEPCAAGAGGWSGRTGWGAGARTARGGMIVAGQRPPVLIATQPVDFRCGQ
jgi:hypothetical protein